MQNFPELNCEGARVDAKSHIERGTGFALVKGYIVGTFFSLIICGVTYGVALLALLIYPFIAWSQNKKALALIHGSGLKVSNNQFDSIFNVVNKISERLGISPPDVYIVESNVLNAFAVKHGKKNVILLTDDIVHGTLVSENTGTLAYILAHEIAHVALGHNGFIRSFIRSKYSALSRLDEYSADSVALALLNNKQDAVAGLIILTVGPHLGKYINGASLATQVKEVASNSYSKKAEKTLSHPLLLNRINKILAKS